MVKNVQKFNAVKNLFMTDQTVFVHLVLIISIPRVIIANKYIVFHAIKSHASNAIRGSSYNQINVKIVNLTVKFVLLKLTVSNARRGTFLIRKYNSA